jgi:hypothetical protein
MQSCGFEICKSSLSLLVRAIRKGRSYCLEQGITSHGLAQEIDGARSQGNITKRRISVTADKYDWHSAVVSKQSPLQLNTAHARQADVENQTSRSFSMGRFEKNFRGVESADRKASCLHDASQRLMKRFVIVDDSDNADFRRIVIQSLRPICCLSNRLLDWSLAS